MLLSKKTDLSRLSAALLSGLLLLAPVAQAADLNEQLFIRQVEQMQGGLPSPTEVTLERGWPKSVKLIYKVGEVFDDNIFLTRKKRNIDWITNIDPELQWVYFNDKNFLRVAGRPDINIYAQNGHQSFWDPELAVHAQLRRTSQVKFSIYNFLTHQTTTGASSVTKPDKSLWNNFGMGAVYDFSIKTALRLDYGFVISNYFSAKSKLNNVMQNIVAPAFQWKFSPKATLSTVYTFGRYDYYHESLGYNQTFHEAAEKIEGYLTEKSKIDFRVGYRYVLFGSRYYVNYGRFVFGGGYDYQWTPKTSFRLFLGHSYDPNMNRVVPITGVTNTVATETVQNSFGGLVARHVFNEKISSILSGYAARSRQGTPAKSANDPPDIQSTGYFDTKAVIIYNIQKYLELLLGYEYRIAISRQKDSEYKDNQATIAIRGAFG